MLLKKEMAMGSINERSVTLLGPQGCSLIPYFKDLDNRDMYIKHVINNNTDKTGLVLYI